MADTSYAPPADIDARRTAALVAGLLGLAVCAVGFAVARDQFFRAWLIAYLLWLGVSLGSMGLMMIHHLSGGSWGMVVRRVFEAASRTLPLMTVLFVPVWLGMATLYPWTHPEHVAADEILQHKAAYLNTPFFLLRAAFYFLGWNLIALFLSRWSKAQDEGDTAVTRKMQRLSGGGLVFYALTITAAAVDWVMSINPHWFSTLYGFIFMGGQGLSALAFVILIAAFLSKRAPMNDVLKANHFHDFGKLTLAFVMLWAYFQFSQYLLIYAANLVEEIPYYITRTTHGWQYVALFLILCQFILPFSLLLSRDLKRASNRLVIVAIGLLVMRFIDLYFLVSPEFDAAGMNLHMEAGEHEGGFFLHWLDIAAPVGIGGIWVWMFFTQLRQRPLLPIRDPYLQDALESTGGH
ncbi:MAG: hypothetical protein HOP14_04760 [Acidobacteria bacterium]|nr:hypothetical protein [Acidobacteriota bacterium]